MHENEGGEHDEIEAIYVRIFLFLTSAYGIWGSKALHGNLTTRNWPIWKFYKVNNNQHVDHVVCLSQHET